MGREQISLLDFISGLLLRLRLVRSPLGGPGGLADGVAGRCICWQGRPSVFSLDRLTETDQVVLFWLLLRPCPRRYIAALSRSFSWASRGQAHGVAGRCYQLAGAAVRSSSSIGSWTRTWCP